MTLHELRMRIRALTRWRRVERELDDELAFHLDRGTQSLIEGGLSPADARGTAFIDATVRDILYAFRAFRRAPFAAATIVATVGLGLGLVAVVFSFYSAMFLRVDPVRRPEELFEVRRAARPGAKTWIALTRPDFEELRRDTEVFATVAAIHPDVEARVSGRALNGTLVSAAFFQMLGVDAALGRPLMPAGDEPSGGRPVVVLSHRGWSKLFPGDETVIGRRLILNGVHCDVIGVMPAGFRGLSVVPPDFWAPLDLLGSLRPALAGKEDAAGIEVIGRLKSGMSPHAATGKLTAWAFGNPALAAINGAPKSIYLRPRQGTVPVEALEGLRQFAPLFVAFGAILLSVCANVANLLLARGVARQREIGVRLSIGASRARIVRQLLTESLLLALAAAICGYVVLHLALAAGISAAMSAAGPEIAEALGLAASASDWRVAVFLACGAIVSTALFGLVPALQATRLELVRCMRGEIARDARPGQARNVLIGLQVGVSATLLIGAAIFLRGMLAAASVEPGLRVSDTVLLEIANETTRAAMLSAVAADPAVAEVAASWPHQVGGDLAQATGARSATVDHKFVSPEYFELFDIRLLRGRLFGGGERSPDAGVVVVSETTARKLWPDGDPIGQTVEIESVRRTAPAQMPGSSSPPRIPFRAFTVVGVVRDARVGQGMFEMVDAGMYLPVSAASPGTSLSLRVHGDPEQARRGLIERLEKIDPALGTVFPLRRQAMMFVYALRIAFALTAMLAALALALTLSGLFAVLSYLVAQRSQEIAVRMALGARPRDIAVLVLAQSSRPVAAGLAAGTLLAGSLAMVLMAKGVVSYAGPIDTLDPVAYASSSLAIVAACALAALMPARRASRIDPILTLKQE